MENPIKEKLKQLVVNGQTEEAVFLLLRLVQKGKIDKKLSDDIVAISSKYELAKGKKILAASHFDRFELDQINTHLFKIINQLDSSGTYGKHTLKKGKWKYVFIFSILIGVLAGIAEFSGYQIKDLLEVGSKDPLQLTIYVHGPNGRQDVILEDRGKIILDLGNERRVETIGENGRVNFRGIPRSLINQEVMVSIDAPGFYVVNSDSLYLLSDTPIYIRVKSDSQKVVNQINQDFPDKRKLDIIQGFVRTRDGEMLSNANVLVENGISTLTDEFGFFQIDITNMKQKQKYLITVSKPGYLITKEYIYPEVGNIEIRLKKNDG